MLHGHRGVPGPDGLSLKYKPHHDVSFDDALAEVHRLALAYPHQVVAIGETGMDLFRTGEGAKELQRDAFREHIALAKELNLPMQIHDRDSHREVIETLLADGSPERTVFHRGRTNAPYMIPYTLTALADVFDLPVAEVARATRRTTRTVYGV